MATAVSRSIAEKLAQMPDWRRRALLSDLAQEDADALMADWRFWARPEQMIPDEEWHGWLIMAGRGFGKNRTAAEGIVEEIRAGRVTNPGFIARTARDVRKVIVEGRSGFLQVCQNSWTPAHWEPSKTSIIFPNGVVGTTYSAEEPDALRGPEHDLVWGDEVSTWQYRETWDNAMFGLRVGLARWIATMTPKGVPLVRELIREAERDPMIKLTGGSTYDNLSNLAQEYIKRILRRYENTRLAKQEIYGLLLEDNPDALWSRALLDATRTLMIPQLVLVVIGVDPQGSTENEESETGIVAAGLDARGEVYVLEDATLSGKPEEWAAEVCACYARHSADIVVGERNYGGDMVKSVINAVNKNIPVELVNASRGKRVRAEPVALLYDQKRAHHLGTFGALEDQMCTWVPSDSKLPSPNRMDALVWAVHRLDPTGDLHYGRDFGVA